MLLKDRECKVLNKIARNSKMDCWFSVKTGKHDGCPCYDYVFDIKYHKRMSLRQGIKELMEGVTEEDILELAEDEKIILVLLLKNLI